MTQPDLTPLEIIRIALKWRKPIISVCLIAIVAAAIVALLLPNQFKSVSMFYAGSSQALDGKSIFNYKSDNVPLFGSDEDVDHLLAIGNSQKLAFNIISKFNLYKAYQIDSGISPYYREAVLKQFNNNYSIKKNDLGALEITVYDEDKQRAAAIANEIMTQIDNYNRETLAAINSKNSNIYKQRYEEKIASLRKLKDSLNNTSAKFGIFDPKTQKELISTETSKTTNDLVAAKAKLNILAKNYNANDTIIINLKAEISGLEERYKNIIKSSGNDFNKGASMVSSLEIEIENKLAEAMEAKEVMEQVTLASFNASSTINVIEYAEPAERKSKPIRWLIVAITFSLTAFLSLLFAVITECYGAILVQYFKNE